MADGSCVAPLVVPIEIRVSSLKRVSSKDLVGWVENRSKADVDGGRVDQRWVSQLARRSCGVLKLDPSDACGDPNRRWRGMPVRTCGGEHGDVVVSSKEHGRKEVE